MQENKKLLLRDLCGRLPYKVIVEFVSYEGEEKPWFGELSCKDLDCFIRDVGFVEIKPYLFPLSSMTEEQKMFLRQQNWCIAISTNVTVETTIEGFDWLNKNHFDYRGLIPMGLAIDATNLNIYLIMNYFIKLFKHYLEMLNNLLEQDEDNEVISIDKFINYEEKKD